MKQKPFEKLLEALRHPLFLTLYFPSFLSFFAGGLLAPVTPLYMASFDVPYSMIGLMLSMPSIGKMLFELPGGVLIPRLGIKKSMVLGMTIIGLATMGMYWSNSPTEVILYQFLIGVGGVFYHTARLSYAASVTDNQYRGRSLSILGGTNRLSRILSPGLGGLLVTTINLKSPFLLSGLIFLAAMVLVAIKVPKIYAQPRPATSNFKVMWQVAKKKSGALWRTSIGAILLSTVRMARFTLIPLYAADVLGLNATQIGLILSIASVADMLNVYTAGTLMDRFGRRFAAIPCVGVMALSMALMPFTAGFWGLLGVSILAGLGNGFGSGIMMTIGSDLAPADNREEFLSLWILVLDAGGAACPLIVGGISDLLTLTASGFAFFGIGILGVLAFLFLVPETRKQTPVPAAVPKKQATN